MTNGIRQFFLVVSLLLSLCAVAGTAHCQPEKRVLLLNSYNQDLAWTASITRGAMEALAEREGEVKVFVEYMDTKNHYSPQYLALLEEQYRFKYRNVRFDAIIASDDNAANFVLRHHHDLFLDAPMVFCGVNDFDLPKRPDFTNATGVLEFTDIASTIRAALSLQPGLKRLYVVCDDTTSGKIGRGHVERTLPDFRDRLDVTWLDDKSLAELRGDLAKLPPDSAVLLVMYNRDRLGNWFTYAEVARVLSQASTAPIYGMWDFFLDKGILGGMITSGAKQGELAARKALRILDGTRAADIPVVLEKANGYVFDYAVLQRFGLDPDRVPEGGIMINVPESLITKYTFEFWTAILFITLLSMAVVILLLNNRARRVAEQELEELSHYQEALIEDRTNELVQRSRELEVANYELRKLDDLKTSVLNTVSHDLRTPLTSVLGFCKIIGRDFKKYFVPACRKNETLKARGRRIISNLAIVENEGERLTRMINDFLDLSKIESGRMVWNDGTLDPASFIDQARPVLEGYFSDTDVTLNIDVEGTLPAINADPDRLHQVLNNLISNAAKFTEKGSVTLTAKAGEEGVDFIVSDTGVGIPQDKLESIFDKFYQVARSKSDTRAARGSGMGLAISKRIAEHYGGSITASSVLGSGSTFTFTIPVTH
ncbi:ATPase [Pseudodesulfovibrio cashew]|uniref:histidine kinase n=1 Tax=Pseudodesulfovibrio cashew TaxID=2678688 RepID=A0A6I6JHE0_9BACT|nr:sensor histidine kinase [Pseudodesulfovibrio cashew]QGY39497.1 ATPase [Pseudodesulfovibrio cashew]